MRLIDADKIIKWADDSVSQYGSRYTNDMLNMFGLFKEIIDNAPTVTIKEWKEEMPDYIQRSMLDSLIPKGEWITTRTLKHDGNPYCSNCDEETIIRYNFCPNCGANMRGKEE